MVNERASRAASNVGWRSSADPISASASRTGWASASARGVGSIVAPWRISSGSSNSWRRRASVLLIPGWLSPTRAAARVTLRSVSSASSATSRLRSTLARFTVVVLPRAIAQRNGPHHEIPLAYAGGEAYGAAMAQEEIPVLIVGGSLVGLSAAVFLAHRGIPVLGVERHDGTAIHPRAGHFHLRTLELLRSVGLEPAVRRLSQERYFPNGGINQVETL